VSSASSIESTDASRSGYGSGASDSDVYALRKAELTDLEWLVRRSMNVW
jgi:hypothetical protein